MTASPTEKRLNVISFRLTDSELAQVQAAAEGMTPKRTPQDWCRAATLHCARARVPTPPPPRKHPARRMPRVEVRLLAETLGHLGKLSSNVNQLARRMNRGGPAPDTAILLAMQEQIAAVANEIRKALEGGHGDQG